MNQDALDNRSNQLNPNNSAYRSSRLGHESGGSEEEGPDPCRRFERPRAERPWSPPTPLRFNLDLVGQCGWYERLTTEMSNVLADDIHEAANVWYAGEVNYFEAAWGSPALHAVFRTVLGAPHVYSPTRLLHRRLHHSPLWLPASKGALEALENDERRGAPRLVVAPLRLATPQRRTRAMFRITQRPT